MKGIEAAFAGVLGKDVELRTAKSGKPWASLAIMVDCGEQDADGHSVMRWVKVAVFGETAERLAGAVKGVRLYVEGSLSLDEWTDKEGNPRHGLSLAAWKAERVGSSAIGRNRVIAKQYAPAEPAAYMPAAVPANDRAGPAERTQAPGRKSFKLDDEMPF